MFSLNDTTVFSMSTIQGKYYFKGNGRNKAMIAVYTGQGMLVG
jgi:hypothetical protein